MMSSIFGLLEISPDAFLRTFIKYGRGSRMLWQSWRVAPPVCWIFGNFCGQRLRLFFFSCTWWIVKMLQLFIFIFIVILFAPQGDALQQGTVVPDCVATASPGV